MLSGRSIDSTTSFERSDKNIRENQGEMNSISRKMSGKMREFNLEITMATLLFGRMTFRCCARGIYASKGIYLQHISTLVAIYL